MLCLMTSDLNWGYWTDAYNLRYLDFQEMCFDYWKMQINFSHLGKDVFTLPGLDQSLLAL